MPSSRGHKNGETRTKKKYRRKENTPENKTPFIKYLHTCAESTTHSIKTTVYESAVVSTFSKNHDRMVSKLLTAVAFVMQVRIDIYAPTVLTRRQFFTFEILYHHRKYHIQSVTWQLIDNWASGKGARFEGRQRHFFLNKTNIII